MRNQIVFILFFCKNLFSQETMSTKGIYNCSGNSISTADINIEYSIGELLNPCIVSNHNLDSFIGGILQPQFQIQLFNNYESLNDQYSIYPNPSNGILVISGNITNKVSIKIYDIVGAEIHLLLQNNTLDLSTLPNGTYTLVVYDIILNISKTSKVIKV